MDAGPASGTARPDLPEEPESKPKSQENQDDGYETSNSGDALRRKVPSTPSPSPPDPAGPIGPTGPTPDPMPPPEVPIPSPPRYDALDLHRAPEPYFARAPAEQSYEPYYRREEYLKPYQAQAQDAYTQFAVKRHDYDQQQHQQQYLKREHECDDPYSFVEEDAVCAMLGAPAQHLHTQLQPPHAHGHAQLGPHTHPHHAHYTHMQHHVQPPLALAQPKKRGRKKKLKDENGMEIKLEPGLEGLVARPVKERKKHDRFNGMSEEEVARRTLPDHLSENLDIIIIGINPGLFAAYKGHHYAGPGNHFWKCLYLSGLTREQMSADEDYKLLNFGIGFTNMVARATKGSADLTRREIKEGSAILLEKLQTYRPKVAVFNGKLIYEVFSGKKDFCFGKQPDTIAGTNTYMWVMPSSSARCAQLPRAADKVPFYAALKKFRDYLNGLVGHVEERELVFPDTTGRRPQEELEIRRSAPARLTMEPEPGETIILEDGTEVPLKKKRGRPKKVKLENGEIAPPTPRAPRQPRAQASLDPGGEQPPKKKRGRPKKIRPDDQQFLLQQQSQQMMSQQQHPPPGPQLPPPVVLPPAPPPQQQPQPPVEQYSMHQPAEFENMMYQGGMLGQQSYFPASPADQSYAPSPQYAASPRPQNLAFGASPRPQGYAASPPARPPPGTPHRSPGQAVFGAASPALHSYTPSPAALSPAGRTPAYCQSPVFARPEYGGAGTTSSTDLQGDMSSPGPASPGMGHIDFEPPIAANKIRVADSNSLPSQENSPMGSTDMHPGSNSNSSLSDFNKTGSGGGSEMSPAPSVGGAPYVYEERYLPRSPDKLEHYHHYQDQGGSGVDSPRLEQLHSHPPIYPNSYNRSTPPVVGSPFSPHYRAPDHAPHTPGSPGEFQSVKPAKSQDVAAKSLSGLESLVDQIPSIADGPPAEQQPPAGVQGGAGQGAGSGTPPEPYLYATGYGYNSYGNNYGAPFVGYGGAWGGQLVRPAPAYLDWQYQYTAPPYTNYPYYNGYPAPAPQQYLAAPLSNLSLELHKPPDTPAVPSVPSVGFGGFC